MKKETKYWLETAEYDFDTAKAMFRTRRYLYVIFMCHLCLEKMLKGCVVEFTSVFPPRTHNLDMLVEVTKLKLPNDMSDFIRKLSSQSVPTRYPKDLKQFTRSQTQDYLQQTEMVLLWLQQRLTSKE